MRILVVDDDLGCRRLMSKMLSSFGECVTASDGLEALNAFRQAAQEGKPFTLVSLDIMMPELDGHETLEAIRKVELQHELPPANVLITTGLGAEESMMRSKLSGNSFYLSKPVSVDEIRKHLASIR